MGVGDKTAYLRSEDDIARGRAADDGVWDSISRVCNTVAVGTAQGLVPALQHKVDNLPETGLEIGIAVGTGLLLSRMQPTSGFGRLAAEAAGLAFSYSFIKHATSEAIPLSRAISSSWNSSSNLENDKKVVASTVSPFLVDTLVTGVPAMTAARIHNWNSDIRQLSGRLAEEAGGSVFKVKVIGGNGSAFLIDSEGTLGTAYHVARASLANKIQIDIGRTSVPARAIAALPYEDVALMKALGKIPGKPLQLAAETTSLPTFGEGTASPGAALGFPGGRAFSARPGRFSNYYDGRKLKSDSEPLDRMLFGSRTEKGMSGGPVVDANNRVIGVNIQGIEDRIGADALASPVENLNKLLRLTEQAKAGHGFTVDEAAQRLRLSPAEVNARLANRKLDGFLKAEDPYDTSVIGGRKTQWSWVVVLPPGS